MNIVIIDYGAGNVFSVENACRKLGYKPVLTDVPDIISAADKVIFPGVGNAISAMEILREKSLDTLIPELKQPVLGICLGMQLLFERSDEGNTNCLSAINGTVSDFAGVLSPEMKIPHMGWNIIENLKGELFEGIDESAYMYFVHSFYLPENEYTTAHSYYGCSISAAVQKDNFFGCQFHPEKSGEKGIMILNNFLEL